jgi:hypothetical protein
VGSLWSRGRIDSWWEFIDCYLKSLLNFIENLRVLIGTNEADSQALSTKPSSSSDPVEIRITCLKLTLISPYSLLNPFISSRHIIINNNINPFNINSSTEKISSNKYSLIEILERLETTDSFLLWKPTMYRSTRKSTLNQNLIQFYSPRHTFDKNYHLVELQRIQKIN